jgi:hypothetical protein
MITKFIDCQPEDATHVRVFDDSGYPNFFPVENVDGMGGYEIQFEAGSVLLTRAEVENLLGQTCWRIEAEVEVVKCPSEPVEINPEHYIDCALNKDGNDEDEYFKVFVWVPVECKGKIGVMTLEYEKA